MSKTSNVRKKSGRPAKDPSQLADAKVTIYLKKDEKEKLEQIAEKEGLALAVFIRSILLKKINNGG